MTQIVKCARFSGIGSALVIANQRFPSICYDGRRLLALLEAMKQRLDQEMRYTSRMEQQKKLDFNNLP